MLALFDMAGVAGMSFKEAFADATWLMPLATLKLCGWTLQTTTGKMELSPCTFRRLAGLFESTSAIYYRLTCRRSFDVQFE